MEIVIILILIALNGLFSMSEIALVSARKSKLQTEARKGNKSAATALRLAGEPDRFLPTVQIGITLIGILTGLYSGEAFSHDLARVLAGIDILAPYSVIIAKTTIVISVTYMTLVFGELIPKKIGLIRSEKMSKIVARPMYVLSKIATPLVWLLSKSTTFMSKVLGIKEDEDSKVTEEEIKAIVKEGMDYGEVQAVEHDIVERVFSLGDRNVGSIMTHRSDVVSLDVNEDRLAVRNKVMEDMYDVYPVVSGGFANLVGAVYLKDLFGHIDSPGFSLRDYVSEPHYVPDNKNVYSALEEFRIYNVKYGFVIDEFGELLGIVTLTDILEALVGQVSEDNGQKDILVRDDGSLLVDGQCSFYDFLEHFDMEYLYQEHDYNTLSGLMLEVLKHIPQEGEKLSWHGFDFEVIDMDGARIDKVLVSQKVEDK